MKVAQHSSTLVKGQILICVPPSPYLSLNYPPPPTQNQNQRRWKQLRRRRRLKKMRVKLNDLTSMKQGSR
jgi:hypothetical protein